MIIDNEPAPEQNQVISVLEEALDAAKKGIITSVAVLSASPGGFNVAVGGSQVIDLCFAADTFKAKVIEIYQSPAPKTKSSIIRPGVPN